ncbi:MAG: hypothetical protein ACOZAA_13085 [Pseudomonadota bacterium]
MKKLILAAIVALSSGCVSNKHDLDETFGAAYSANMTAEIVDPVAAEGAPQGDGAAVDLATIRYKTDKVKPPTSGQFKPGVQSSGGQAPQ